MKNISLITFVALMFVAQLSFASTITINPGATVTINGGDTVTCTGAVADQPKCSLATSTSNSTYYVYIAASYWKSFATYADAIGEIKTLRADGLCQ